MKYRVVVGGTHGTLLPFTISYIYMTPYYFVDLLNIRGALLIEIYFTFAIVPCDPVKCSLLGVILFWIHIILDSSFKMDLITCMVVAIVGEYGMGVIIFEVSFLHLKRL